MTGWGSLTTAEAESMRAYSDAGLTTELAIEVVSNDEIHIKVPTLTSSSEIYVTYDGIRSPYLPTDTYGRNAVWGDYAGVYHLNEHATIINSTGGTNGTGFSTVSGDVVDGAVGKGLELLSDGDYLSLPCGNITNTYTIQILYKKNGNPTNQSAGLERAASTGNFTNGMQSFRINSNSTVVFFDRTGNTGQNTQPASSATVGNNTWNWIHHTVSSGSQIGYINGSSAATTTSAKNSYSLTSDFFLNRTYNTTPGYANATYDEVRMRTGQLSANWIETEYNNQNDVASFWGTVTDVTPATTLQASAGFFTIS